MVRIRSCNNSRRPSWPLLPRYALVELRWELSADGAPAVSLTTIWSTLRRLDLTYKKKSLRAAEQERPDLP